MIRQVKLHWLTKEERDNLFSVYVYIILLKVPLWYIKQEMLFMSL